MIWYRYGTPTDYKRSEKNNLSKHPLYPIWLCMKQRCYDKNSISYQNYGNRGIRVCDRWKGIDGFKNFLSDMGERPSGHSIDRIDNDGDYTPDNCRWSTPQEQSLNKRIYRNNVSGKSGVTRYKNKWRATIGYKKESFYLGDFEKKSDAIHARQIAEGVIWN